VAYLNGKRITAPYVMVAGGGRQPGGSIVCATEPACVRGVLDAWIISPTAASSGRGPTYDDGRAAECVRLLCGQGYAVTEHRPATWRTSTETWYLRLADPSAAEVPGAGSSLPLVSPPFQGFLRRNRRV
jgi:hypothetical protein